MGEHERQVPVDRGAGVHFLGSLAGRREWPSPSLKPAPAATPPSPPSGARPSVVALPRLGGLGSCWGSIRFGSESRPGQVRHGRLVVGGLRSPRLTVVVSSCSVGARGMQHETGRGRWAPGTGASSPSPRTGPGPPVPGPGDWAGRNSNLTRGGLSGSVALCANFNEGSQAGPLMVGLGPRPCERVSAGSPSTDESLSLGIRRGSVHTLNGSRFQTDTGRSS